MRSSAWFTYVLIIGWLLTCIEAQSQVIQTHRYEKPNKASDDAFTIISLKQEGLALVRGTNKYKAGNRSWTVLLLDTALHQTDSLNFEVDNNSSLTGYDHSPGFIHVLFVKSNTQGHMQLVSINRVQKEVNVFEIKPELTFTLTHFHSVGSNYIFGGFVNQDPCVLLYNPKTENLKVIPGFFKKDTELLDLRVNQNQTFNTVLYDRSNFEHKAIYFKTFDASGKELLETSTPIDFFLTPQSGISSSLVREDMVLLGTWGKNKAKAASGFYSIPIDPFNNTPLTKIHFGELQHYLDYLKPKRAEDVKTKTQKALENNRIPDYSSNVMPFKILEHSTGFILLAEVHSAALQQSPNFNNYPYPYNSPYSPYMNPYGAYYPSQRYYIPRTYGNNMVSSEEIKKIETVAVNIGPTGKLIWDFSFKFDEIKAQGLNQTSEIALAGDSLYLVFKAKSDLKIKSINLDTREANETSQSIKLELPTDKIVWEEEQNTAVECWFDNVFYVAGYQTIANKTKQDRKRDIFYINKIIIR